MSDFLGFNEQLGPPTEVAVMVDLETLGLTPRAVIVSIGAVSFDPRGTGHTGALYCTVTRASQEWQVGLQNRETDEATLRWWLTQPDKVRDVLDDPEALTLAVALTKLREWFPPGATIWGNGSDFDVAKLDDAYAQLGIKSPWEFFNVRCYRTLKNLPGADRAAKPPRFDRHNALADAAYQATHAQSIFRELFK